MTKQERYRKSKTDADLCGYCGRRKLFTSGRCKPCYDRVKTERRVRYWRKKYEQSREEES